MGNNMLIHKEYVDIMLDGKCIDTLAYTYSGNDVEYDDIIGYIENKHPEIKGTDYRLRPTKQPPITAKKR